MTFQPDPNGKKKSKYPSDLEVVLCNLDKKADNPCKVSKNERFDRPTQFFIVFMTEERRRGKFSKGVVEASLWLLDSTTGEEIEIAKGSRTLDPETGIFVDFPPPAELLQLSPPVGETSIEQHLERSSGRFVVRLKFSGMRKLKRNQDSYRLLMGFVEPDPVR